jgi:hypothetical protein
LEFEATSDKSDVLSTLSLRHGRGRCSPKREQTSMATILQRKLGAILETQRKLDDLERQLDQQGVTLIGRSRLKFEWPKA